MTTTSILYVSYSSKQTEPQYSSPPTAVKKTGAIEIEASPTSPILEEIYEPQYTYMGTLNHCDTEAAACSTYETITEQNRPPSGAHILKEDENACCSLYEVPEGEKCMSQDQLAIYDIPKAQYEQYATDLKEESGIETVPHVACGIKSQSLPTADPEQQNIYDFIK